jgi:hypothetical protein
VRALGRDVAQLFGAEGEGGLLSIPHIGTRLAAAIVELLSTGRLRLLERLKGDVGPEALFATIPGIGPELAHRVVERIHCDTLEDLEVAAADGRLDAVPGFGPRRVRLVRDQLATALARSHRRSDRWAGRGAEGSQEEPPVALLLEVDRIYRERAAAGTLACIAPRRFNPCHRAWLPILHLDREAWSFTALYSNTARAHRLGRTHDWVVIHFDREGSEGQCTVVTEHHGIDAGLRVVRGRERECAELHRSRRAAHAADIAMHASRIERICRSA